MKKAVLALLLTICLVLAGCSSGSIDVDIKALASDILYGVEFDDDMSNSDIKNAAEIYGVEMNDVEDGVFYVGTGAFADEISIWKARDGAAASEIKKAAEQRIKDQADAYGDYKSSEVPKLSEAVVIMKDRYVVLCVSKDSAGARKIIDGYFK